MGAQHSFLRHVERSAGLVYVVDASGGVEGGEEALPWEQLRVLRAELEAYQPVRPRPIPSFSADWSSWDVSSMDQAAHNSLMSGS